MTKVNGLIVPVNRVLSWITALLEELIRVNGEQAVRFSPCGGFQLESQLNILVHNTYVFRAVRYQEVEDGLWQVHMDEDIYDYFHPDPANKHVRRFLKQMQVTASSAPAPTKEITKRQTRNPLDAEEFLCWADFVDDPGYREEHPDWPRAVAEFDEVNRLLTLSRKQLVQELFTNYVGRLNRKEIDLSQIVIKKSDRVEHTLQSEPIAFDGSDACHEKITESFVETISLINMNADKELADKITSSMIGYGNGFMEGLADSGKSTDVVVQAIVERPVITHNTAGEEVIACFVGIYARQRSDDVEVSADLVHTFALVLDPSTRRIINKSAVEMGEEYGTRIIH